MNFALKTMNFDEFRVIIDGIFEFKMVDFVLKNDGFCIQNTDTFHRVEAALAATQVNYPAIIPYSPRNYR